MTRFFYSASIGGFYPDDVFAMEQMPSDAVEISSEEYHALLNGQSDGKEIKPGSNGRPYLSSPPPLTDEQEVRTYEKVVQSHMDAAARGYGYDSISTAVSYAEEPIVNKFQREGWAFREWRSTVWELCYDTLAKYKSGAIEKPTVEQLIASLPALVIPSV